MIAGEIIKLNCNAAVKRVRPATKNVVRKTFLQRKRRQGRVQLFVYGPDPSGDTGAEERFWQNEMERTGPLKPRYPGATAKRSNEKPKAKRVVTLKGPRARKKTASEGIDGKRFVHMIGWPKIKKGPPRGKNTALHRKP